MLKYAISPVRDLQIDNLYIALLNYIVAKQTSDDFILFIQDLEVQNNSTQAGDIIEILKKFAIDAKHTIYQSQNLKTYQLFAKRALQDDKAYVCFCNEDSCKNSCIDLSKQEVQSKIDSNNSYSIYIKEPRNTIFINDKIKGKTLLNPSDIGSFKIIDQNLNPTQTFANAIDNMSSNITTIIRDEKEIIETFKELYIQNMLGYNQDIEYIHLPSILDKKSDLSSIIWLFKEGFLPDAIIDYLISLNYDLKKDIHYLPDIINNLVVTKVTKNRKYNFNELKEFNKKHLELIDSIKLSSIVGFADESIGELLKYFLKDATTINELEKKFSSIFSKKECDESLKELSKLIFKAPMINSYDELIEYLLKNCSLDKKTLEVKLQKLISKDDTIDTKEVYPFIKTYIMEVAKCQ